MYYWESETRDCQSIPFQSRVTLIVRRATWTNVATWLPLRLFGRYKRLSRFVGSINIVANRLIKETIRLRNDDRTTFRSRTICHAGFAQLSNEQIKLFKPRCRWNSARRCVWSFEIESKSERKIGCCRTYDFTLLSL